MIPTTAGGSGMGEGNRFWNPDLAPTGPEQRSWAWYHYAALWIGMIVAGIVTVSELMKDWPMPEDVSTSL